MEEGYHVTASDLSQIELDFVYLLRKVIADAVLQALNVYDCVRVNENLPSQALERAKRAREGEG